MVRRVLPWSPLEQPFYKSMIIDNLGSWGLGRQNSHTLTQERIVITKIPENWLNSKSHKKNDFGRHERLHCINNGMKLNCCLVLLFVFNSRLLSLPRLQCFNLAVSLPNNSCSTISSQSVTWGLFKIYHPHTQLHHQCSLIDTSLFLSPCLDASCQVLPCHFPFMDSQVPWSG